jgi:integrase/recombinase XerD
MKQENVNLGAVFHGEVHPKEELIKDFAAFEARRGGRPAWVKNIPYRIRPFFRFLENTGRVVEEVCRAKDALAYQGWLLEQTTKSGKKFEVSTIKCHMTAVSLFYAWMKKRGMVYTNPFCEIKKVRGAQKLPRHIPKEQELDLFLESLLHFDEGKTLKDKLMLYRTHVMAELQYSTGLRIAEAASLKVSDVDFRRSIVEVRDGKGGFARMAFLTEYSREILRLYIERMRVLVFTEWNTVHGDLLFGVSPDVLGRMTNRVLRKTAQTMNVAAPTSHVFRHALGYHLLRAGCNIRHIQQILGHKSIKNTEIYTKVEKEDLREVIDKCHPRTFAVVSDKS